MKTITKAAKRLKAAVISLAALASDRVQAAEIVDRLKDIDNTIADADKLLDSQHKSMTFKEFFGSPFSVEKPWCRLTVSTGIDTLVGLVLRWNPENYKWHLPQALEGFEEVGHMADIGPIHTYGGLKGRIEAVQIIVSADVLMAN